MTHAELEQRLHTDGLALLRQLLQDSLDLRAMREERLDEVVDADGHERGSVEYGHDRGLASIFGEVTVARMAYRSRGRSKLHPADAALNLPAEKHSHGLRRLAALEAARGSFADAGSAIERATGVRLGKRQVEDLAARAAVDVDGFYATHAPAPAPDTDVLVMTYDAKGVVMRPEALREVRSVHDRRRGRPGPAAPPAGRHRLTRGSPGCPARPGRRSRPPAMTTTAGRPGRSPPPRPRRHSWH